MGAHNRVDNISLDDALKAAKEGYVEGEEATEDEEKGAEVEEMQRGVR